MSVTSDPQPPSTAPATPVPRGRGRGALCAAWEWFKSVQVAFVAFLLVRAFLVEAFKIPSGSMEGTLLIGDFLLVNKLVYGAEVPFTGARLPAVRRPAAGDVIVFQWPQDPTKHFVKRLVGLPGDTVAMRDGALLRNGRALDEPYARHMGEAPGGGDEAFDWQRPHLIAPARAAGAYHPSRHTWGPLVVPPHAYFVLGDNRDNSLDSRYWGFVPDTLVRGRPMFVYYSFVPDSAEPLAWLTRVRWHRLGDRIE